MLKLSNISPKLISLSKSSILNSSLSRSLSTSSYYFLYRSRIIYQAGALGRKQILVKPDFSKLTENVSKEIAEKTAHQFVRHTALGIWYGVIAFMAAGAVVIGGITRLTESGLSMTSWHLIKDIKRPQTEEEWQKEFARYKTFPEFEDVHSDIDLEKFKYIFFWEWFHRNWGRSIGGIFILPYLYFHLKGKNFNRIGNNIKGLGKQSHFLLALLGCQGLYGWYMVKSGLDKKHLDSRLDSNIARVSQYRLAGHLSMALILYSFCFNNALKCLVNPAELKIPGFSANNPIINPENKSLISRARKLKRMAPGMTIGMVALSILSGAFVAGLDAGTIYNNWPHMADEGILPVDAFSMKPLWRDMLENPTTVQLEHRFITHLAFLSLMSVCLTGYRCRAVLPKSVQYSLAAVFAASWMQVALGISALLYQCPIKLAASHQSGSVALLSTCLTLRHFMRKIPK